MKSWYDDLIVPLWMSFLLFVYNSAITCSYGFLILFDSVTIDYMTCFFVQTSNGWFCFICVSRCRIPGFSLTTTIQSTKVNCFTLCHALKGGKSEGNKQTDSDKCCRLWWNFKKAGPSELGVLPGFPMKQIQMWIWLLNPREIGSSQLVSKHSSQSITQFL